jgi:hypothetical protein
MNNRAHWKAMHTRAAGFHLAKARHHQKLKELHSKLAVLNKASAMADDDDDDDEAGELHGQIADCHEAAANEHISMGEFHTSLAKSLEHDMGDMTDAYTGKAMGMGAPDDLVPIPGVMAVIGDVPADAHLRMVTRPGQPRDFAKVDAGLPAPLREGLFKIE